jgi:hypothetical protein
MTRFALGLVFLCSCATVSNHRVRTRPTTESIHTAFERVNRRAQRCLQPGERVTVGGAFYGTNGAFVVDHMSAEHGSLREVASACVRIAMEDARVRSFGNGRQEATWTVSLPEVSARVLAMMQQRETSAPMFVGGTIDPNEVMRLVLTRFETMKQCYEDILRDRPTLHGNVEVRFTIASDGTVSQAQAMSARGMAYVGNCVSQVVRTIVFPRPIGGNVDFALPFAFAPAAPSPPLSTPTQTQR